MPGTISPSSPPTGSAAPLLRQGQIWWADLGEPRVSGPGYRRPVLILQANAFNRSRLATVVDTARSTNLRWAEAPGNEAPGNLLLPQACTGLPRDSVANFTQIFTLNKDELDDYAGKLSAAQLAKEKEAARLVLGL
ncbi:MAG: type II toxin-antitoxin system PemK/MazF family toxin [Bryobacter sp.]